MCVCTFTWESQRLMQGGILYCSSPYHLTQSLLLKPVFPDWLDRRIRKLQRCGGLFLPTLRFLMCLTMPGFYKAVRNSVLLACPASISWVSPILRIQAMPHLTWILLWDILSDKPVAEPEIFTLKMKFLAMSKSRLKCIRSTLKHTCLKTELYILSLIKILTW